MYLIYLSGFFPKLAEAEALTKLEVLSCSYKKKWPFIFFEPRIGIKKLGLEKLGMAHSVHKILAKGNKKKIIEKIRKMPKIDRKFAVRIKIINEHISEKEKKNIIDAIWSNSSKKVDLNHPEALIEVFVMLGDIMITEKIFDIVKSFLKTSAPYKKPITLDPRISRAMSNLTGIKKGDVLDPFCGTGLLLKEAALMGLNAYGSDLSEEMVKGAKENFSYFGLKGIFKQADSTKLEKTWKRKFDAIITDPPYGISTSLFKKNVCKLYCDALESMNKRIKIGGKIVMVVPDITEPMFSKKAKKLGLKKIYKIHQRVHKSLSRYFFVLRKSK